MSLFGSAVILAGGKSLRMGFDKCFLELGGETLISRQVSILKFLFDDIMIAAASDLPLIVNNSRTIMDEYPDLGPIGGIYQGLKSSASDYIFFIGCDMPVINLDYIRYMMRVVTASFEDIYITANGEFVEPLNAFYSKKLIRPILSMLASGRNSLHDLFLSSSTITIPEVHARVFDPQFEMFINLNNQKDIASFKDRAKSQKEKGSLAFDLLGAVNSVHF